MLIDQEQGRVHVIGTGLDGGGIHAQQQVGLVLDRHVHGVLGQRRAPADFAHAGSRRQNDGRGLGLGVGLGNRHRLAGGRRNFGIAQGAGGTETPGAVGNHADAHTEGFGVHDVLHLVFAGDHKLAQVAAHAHIAVGRAGITCGIHRGIGDGLFQGHVHFGGQGLGGDGAAEARHHQASHAEACELHEIASIHCGAPGCLDGPSQGTGVGLQISPPTVPRGGKARQCAGWQGRG